MSVWVTPSLLCGPEPCTTGIPMTLCETADEAIAAIRGSADVELGGVQGAAWIARDDWDQIAFDVMTGLGATPEWARRNIHYARTGALLPEEAFAE